MEAFASRYCLCTPGVFQSTDTCYVLSFTIIMLNTSFHNHNVQDKPTAERFITMNHGIEEGGDLTEELLRTFYESIKNEPFKILEDDGKDWTQTFFNLDLESCLLKNYFELYNPSHKMPVIKASKTEADGPVVERNHVEYRISSPSPEEKEEWMKSIKESISRDPFYDMLATRKRRIAIKK